jgi:hypothetical protein
MNEREVSTQSGGNTDPMSDLRDKTADQVRKVADRAEDLATSKPGVWQTGPER